MEEKSESDTIYFGAIVLLFCGFVLMMQTTHSLFGLLCVFIGLVVLAKTHGEEKQKILESGREN